jgi:tetratricopeptide (TPR) repeat protein
MIALLLAVSIFMQRPGALQPGSGIVTGTIKVEGGASAAGVRVGAVDVDDPTASSFLSVTETDAAGNYRLTNVPAGRYYIVAGRLNSLRYYPDGASPAQANEIQVEAARVRTGVNFTVAAGSARPVPPTPRAAGTINSFSPAEFTAYRAILAEPNADRKARLLLDFQKQFPKSIALPQVYVSLMNIYMTRGDARTAMEYGERVLRSNPDDVTALLQVSRNYTILQTNTKKAVEYAERASVVAARMKTQPPQNGMDAANWRKYVTSLDASAQANLTWVKKSAAWQQQQFLSLIAPRRAQ